MKWIKKIVKLLLPGYGLLKILQQLQRQNTLLEKHNNQQRMIYNELSLIKDIGTNIGHPMAGERQVERDLTKIRIDHRARYNKASEYISSNQNILDIACGVGYGSYILATNHSSCNITSVDISPSSIKFAKKYYDKKNINYLCQNALKFEISPNSFDVIVSFETIEHIDRDDLFISKISKGLTKTGLLILSTPNNDFLEFSKKSYPFHIRHYNQESITKIASDNQLEIVEVFSQPDRNSPTIIHGWNGLFNIIVLKKRT